jgi:DedD protein
MDQGLKERLVGAAVLVAIAVWLIPWVLDGPEGPLETSGSSLQLPAAEEPMPMRTQTLRLGDAAEQSAEPGIAAVPPPAAEPVPPVAAPADAAAQTAVEPAVQAAAPSDPPAIAATRPEPERTAAAPSQPPATAPKPAPAPVQATGDWTVQLGSFGEEANAQRLAQRAGTFGYKAEVSSYRSGGRTLYRVRVGPQATRAAAEAAASALRAHGVEASVVAAR